MPVSSLRKHGILTEISKRVQVARRRFGHYEVIDFLAVLFGYAISGERTLEEFYEQLQPFAVPCMALFERDADGSCRCHVLAHPSTPTLPARVHAWIGTDTYLNYASTTSSMRFSAR
jgi:hypothetical protein